MYTDTGSTAALEKAVEISPTTREKKRRVNFTRLLQDMVGYVGIIVLVGMIILPFLWMVLTSFKPGLESFRYPPTLLPERWTLFNYKALLVYPTWDDERIDAEFEGEELSAVQRAKHEFDSRPLTRGYFNTLRIFVFRLIGIIVVSGLAGYGFAKIEFRGREVLFILVLISKMIPGMMTLLPQYFIFKTLGWVGGPLPLIVPTMLFGGTMAVFFFRQHFRTIPNELIEAAVMDGASHWRIFWQMMMPLSKAVITSLTTLTFMGTWNELLGPLIYLTKPGQYTAVQAIYGLIREWGNAADPQSAGLRLAGAVISAMPVLIVFFLSQRYFIAGLTQGAVKE